MSELSRIQEEILRRFQRPQPMDERLPQGTMPGRGEVGPVRLGGDMPASQSTAVHLGGNQPIAQSSAVPLGGQRSVFAPPQQIATADDPSGTGQRLTPNNPAAITRQRSVFAPPPTADLSNEGFGSTNEPFGTRDRRTQPRDYVADDTQYLRDLNAEPRNWKDKSIDALRAVNSVWGSNPKAFTPTKREREIGETEQRIEAGAGTDLKRAQTAAALGRPAIQQAAQDEREINNALSQYNRLESFDPDDPADIGLKEYFDKRGLRLPKKLKGSNQVLIWRNGKAELVDKVGAEIRPTTIGGQVAPGDVARTPNAAGLTPSQQSTASIAAANEAGRARRATTAETGRNTRQREQIAAANTRAANKPQGGGRASNGASASQVKAANALAAKYNLARKAEMSTSIPAEKKHGLKAQREVLWQQIMASYPGMFEADDNGELRQKAGQFAQPSESGGKRWSASQWAQTNPNGDVEAAKKAATARGYIVTQ